MATDRVRRQPSVSSHRSLYITSSRNSSSTDVFSDDFAIEDFTIADGFHPASTAQHATSTRPRPHTPSRLSLRRSASQRATEDAVADPTKRRSIYESAAQASSSRNSFTLRNDAPTRTLQQSQPEMSQHRPVSMVSSFSIPRAQSPYVGASGPSHPYAMYPQETSLNRSSTTSTVRQTAERPYSGPSHPVHPYAMYSQDTAPELQSDPLAASRDIATVGFPGLSQGLTRRIGPSGEDADYLIGQDGYTEQLPPYTRYPDALSPKGRYAPGNESLLSPETSNAQEPSSPQERLLEAQPAGEGDGDGGVEVVEATDAAGRLAASKAKWARKGKRRFFRGKVPAWVLCLGMLLIVVIAASVGGVIGHYISQDDHDSHTNNKNETPMPETQSTGGTAVVMTITTTLIDASPLASTPTNLPPLPSGNFGFALNSPSQASSDCLTSLGQAQAWSCADGGAMLWSVTPSDIAPSQVSLTWTGEPGPLQYGPQPPNMPFSIGLTLMEDVEQPQLGPAFFFQAQYNKTVILPPNTLNTSVPPVKRSFSERVEEASDWLHGRDPQISPGDQPWVCYWNGTLLEGFIYVDQADPDSAEASSLVAAGSITFSTSEPYSTLSSTSRPQSTTASYSQMSITASGTASSPTTPPYPMDLKIAERRVPGNPVRPYCYQVLVEDNMTLTSVLGTDGQPVTVLMEEYEPETQQRVALGGSMKGQIFYPRSPEAAKRDVGACLCEWMIP